MAISEYLSGPTGQQYLYKLINNTFNKTDINDLAKLDEKDFDHIFNSLFYHLVERNFIKK